MLKFNTRDKKPKIWNVAVLAAVTCIAVVIMVNREPVNLKAVVTTICIAYALAIIFLVNALIKQIQYNPYSYNTIYYAGFALFGLVGLFGQISLFGWMKDMPFEGKEGVLSLLSTLLDTAFSFMVITAPFILVFSIGLCVSNIQLIRYEGKRFVNVLGIILSFLLVGGEAVIILSNYYVSGSVGQVMVRNTVNNVLAAFYIYFECMLIGTIISNLIVVFHKPEFDKDALIILGCGLRKDGTPTPLLAGRIERALKFYREQIEKTGKAPVLVPSGGQGPNEVISESDSMKAYLLKQGIPEEHILQEDQSKSTYENMLFSKREMEKAGVTGNVAFVTTNYHVFRSGLMARRVKMRAIGMGAKTKWYFWPNAAVREFVGILTDHRLKQALILGGLVLFYAASTILLYTVGFGL